MKKNTDVLNIFKKYTPLVDQEILGLLAVQDNLLMYKMMSYFFGYLDEHLDAINNYGGKRFRPGICMLLSDFYGVLDESLELATAVEIYHNFTLIHDDIADKDEIRRDRPTVWKKWGLNQALNTGDGQLILVYKEINKFLQKYPEKTTQVLGIINEKFLQVIEGQHLDFLFSELPLGNPTLSKENTLDMMARKSGILVGLPAVLAGMVANKDQKELDYLWDYGYNLGITYQYCDDIVSIWGDKASSGKIELADIREKKKTIPIIHLYEELDDNKKQILSVLYSKTEDLSDTEVKEVKDLIDSSNSKDYTIECAKGSLEKVNTAITKLSLTDEQKKTLNDINLALFAIIGENL